MLAAALTNIGRDEKLTCVVEDRPDDRARHLESERPSWRNLCILPELQIYRLSLSAIPSHGMRMGRGGTLEQV